MKKNYFEPQAEIVELETFGFLAGSVGDIDGGGEDGEYTGNTGTDTSSSDWGSDY